MAGEKVQRDPVMRGMASVQWTGNPPAWPGIHGLRTHESGMKKVQ
jgi:hypothetical protein